MLDMKERSVKSMMKSGGKDAAPATGKLANRRTRVARAERGNPADLMLLLYSQKPKQRATLARTASPTVPATEARVRAEAKITPAGITSNRRRDA